MSVSNKPLLQRSKKLFENILSINVAVCEVSLLAQDMAKNKLISMVQRNQHLSFKYMEFILYFREIIFVTDVAVLTIETINLVFKFLDIF